MLSWEVCGRSLRPEPAQSMTRAETGYASPSDEERRMRLAATTSREAKPY